MIKARVKKEGKRIRLDVSGLDRTNILHVIRSAYRTGYSTIEVYHKNLETTVIKKSSSVQVRDVVRDEATKLIGAQVQTIDAHNCLILIQHTQPQDVYDIIKRSMKNLLHTSEELVLLFKGHLYVSSVIEEQHNSTTKLVSYCIRELHLKEMKGLSKEHEKDSLYFHILLLIDKVADLVKYLARDYAKTQRVMSRTGIALFEEISKCFVNAHQLFVKYNAAHLIAFSTQRDDLKRKITESVKGMDAREAHLIGQALAMVELLVELVQSRMALENTT